MAQQVDASRIGELEQVVTSALAEAQNTGASQADADASLQRGLTATCGWAKSTRSSITVIAVCP